MKTTPENPAFFAYGSHPAAIGQEIKAAVEKVRSKSIYVHPWNENDISGVPLISPILEQIDRSPFVIADVTKPNFNVYFEIGYAIGKGKRAFLVNNSGLKQNSQLVREIGLLDSVGYDDYENSEQLAELISGMNSEGALPTGFPKLSTAPMYVVEPPISNRATHALISAIKKKARIRYRAFTPAEHIRISATQALQEVASSSGLALMLMGEDVKDYEVHNTRTAFFAGLGIGLDIPTLILIEYGNDAPLDVRDVAKHYRDEETLQGHVADFIPDVVSAMQAGAPIEPAGRSALASLSIGDPAAENEMQRLAEYYVETDAFGKALRGEVNLVVGRKGMGKTALFSQIRDRVREDKKNIVVDLKPESYQLIRLKEEVLAFVSEGTKAHLISTIWEYVLYLEICYKLLEKDERLHKHDHDLYARYEALREAYFPEGAQEQGDFSERLYDLADSVRVEFEQSAGSRDSERLNANQVTELVHKHDLHNLRSNIVDYLRFKKTTWILFDNLDKGWLAKSIDDDDVLIIRCLIDAANKIQRELNKSRVKCQSIVFVRNDIYELLISQASDFGKESRVSLDWSREQAMKELVKRRICPEDMDIDFGKAWNKYFVSHVKGEESFSYIMSRALMRPRNIIKIINHCKGDAVVRRLDKIDEDAIHAGVEEFSNDIIVEANRELSDIEQLANNVLYGFIGTKKMLSYEDVNNKISEVVQENGGGQAVADRVLDFMIYFGFIGIGNGSDDPEFIYDFRYNMELLTAKSKKCGNELKYHIHPAFWPVLQVS